MIANVVWQDTTSNLRSEQMIQEYQVDLALEDCISRLQQLPNQYASVKLDVALTSSNGDNCKFRLRATGVKSEMNQILSGTMKRLEGDSTQVTIEDITPIPYGYSGQYLWIGFPIVILAAFLVSNPFILLGVPGLAAFSLSFWVSKQQDRDEMIRIIERMMEVRT